MTQRPETQAPEPSQPDEAVEVLRAVWTASGQSGADLDREHAPSDDLDREHRPRKSCKKMQHVGFDGMAEPGTDLRDAWRERLEREGKRNTSQGTIRDLVLGPARDE